MCVFVIVCMGVFVICRFTLVCVLPSQSRKRRAGDDAAVGLLAQLAADGGQELDAEQVEDGTGDVHKLARVDVVVQVAGEHHEHDSVPDEGDSEGVVVDIESVMHSNAQSV